MPKNHRTNRNSRVRADRRSRRRERHLSIRSELRREPDVRKIARAVVALAMAQAAQEAAAERQHRAVADDSDPEESGHVA
jgi:hypothetical protein